MIKGKSSPSTSTRMTPEEVAEYIAALQAKSNTTAEPVFSQTPIRKGSRARRLLISAFLVLSMTTASTILWWMRANWYVVLAPIFLLILVWLIFIGRSGLPNKTLWDVLEVILIPLILGGYTLYMTAQQTTTMQQQNRIADEQVKIEIFQNYTSTIQDLIDHESLQSTSDEHVRAIAKTQTALALGQLDGERKTNLLRFIYRLNLINEPDPIIDLNGDDLSGANLSGTDLHGVDLSGANLKYTNLSYANLSKSDFIGADLYRTDLSYANLRKADLSGADLSYANLYRADLSYAHVVGANLSYADVTGAIGISK